MELVKGHDDQHDDPTDYTDISVKELAIMFFPDGWKPRTRFPNHSMDDRLRFLMLAGLIMGHRFTETIVVNFKLGHRQTCFMRLLNDAVRQAGGKPLSYVGLFSSFRTDENEDVGTTVYQHPHGHYVVNMPLKGTVEYDVMTRFLIRYGEIKPRIGKHGRPWSAEFLLRKRAAMDEPMQPVYMTSITNKGWSWNGLVKYANYLDHHADDAAKIHPDNDPTVKLTASRDISALAAEIAANPIEALAGIVGKTTVPVPTQCLTKTVAAAAGKPVDAPSEQSATSLPPDVEAPPATSYSPEQQERSVDAMNAVTKIVLDLVNAGMKRHEAAQMVAQLAGLVEQITSSAERPAAI